VTPLFFATPAAWRRWLARHHATAPVAWVGFHKKGTGKPSITWPESVDEALCFGWIDGVRKRLDADSYVIRFTPRRAGSTWSAVNVRRVAALGREGRMTPAGRRAYDARTAAKTAVYSFEQRRSVRLPAPCARRFRGNAAAWRFFTSQAPWYQRTAAYWVISAKREETREKRLCTLIADSAMGRPIKPLLRVKK
jgi:uncharacterized protein YdeI (YjbR/CyaY-like superfamily)